MVFISYLFIIPLFYALFLHSHINRQETIFKVRTVFYLNGAVEVQNTNTVDELGLNQLNFLQGLWRLRDYKPYVFQILTQQGIVGMTEDGKLYMLEDKPNENLSYRGTYQPTKCESSSSS